jgi:ketosteroid isomerase-like protein
LSERNVAVVINVYRAVNENDLSRFVDLMHPEVELLTSGVYPDFKPSYRGHSGAADYWQAARSLWDNFEVEIKRCKAVGDRVLVLLNQRVSGTRRPARRRTERSAFAVDEGIGDSPGHLLGP